jgi:CelD/BcsL family acetyltransferase involved in cellulose biosynthesis
MPYRIEEVESPSDMREMSRTWESVLLASDENDVFHTHDWMRVWWDIYGKGRKMLVLDVKEEGESVAIAPFMISYLGKIVRSGLLEFIGTGQSDRLGILVKRGSEGALQEVWRHLSQRGGWDSLDLRDMAGWGATSQSFRSAFPQAQIEESPSPCLSLEGTYQEYLASLSSNTRHNLARCWKRLTNEKGVEFRTYKGVDDMDFCMRTLLKLNALRWEEHGTSTLTSERFETFLKEALPLLAQKGYVRFHMLLSQGEPFSVTLGFEYRSKYLYYLSGFNPEFGAYGPGRSILNKIIEDAFARRLKDVDLLRGDEEYKYKFGATDRKLVRGTVGKAGLKSRMPSLSK